MFYGQNFNHNRNYHTAAVQSPPLEPATARTASQPQPQPAAVSSCAGGSSIAACCRMAIPMFPVDMGIDIASVRAEIDNCKRRYQREVWNVLCGKALQGSEAAATGGSSWKKPDDHRDKEHVASATSGAGVAKQAPPAPGYAKGNFEENTPEEDHQPAGPAPEAKSPEEEVTTDEAVNDNNLINRLAAKRRSVSQQLQRRPQSQSRRVVGNANNVVGISSGGGGGGGGWQDDWRNFNNSTHDQRRAAVRQLLPPPHSNQPPRRQPEVMTAQPQTVSQQRRYNPEYDDGNDEVESSGDDDDAAFAAGQRCNSDLADNYSFGTSDSSGDVDECPIRRRFVPIFCGNWAAAGVGRSSRRQLRSRMRRRSGLTVTYHEPMPASPGDQQSARF